MRGNGVFCHIDNDQAPPLNVYGNDGVQRMLDALFDEDAAKDIRFTRTAFFQSYQAENGLTFTFLPCQHKADEDSGFYMVEKDGKRLVYAQDTGLFLEETLRFLAGKPLDLLSLDCCFGKRSSGGWGTWGCRTISRWWKGSAKAEASPAIPASSSTISPTTAARSTKSSWRKPLAMASKYLTTA